MPDGSLRTDEYPDPTTEPDTDTATINKHSTDAFTESTPVFIAISRPVATADGSSQPFSNAISHIFPNRISDVWVSDVDSETFTCTIPLH